MRASSHHPRSGLAGAILFLTAATTAPAQEPTCAALLSPRPGGQDSKGSLSVIPSSSSVEQPAR